MQSTYIFSIHFFCYWMMVVLYDENIPPKIFWKSALSSLKNQLIFTYPLFILLFKYYPLKYDNLLLSFGYIPILIISGDIYFYMTHRPLHSKWLFKYHKSHHTGVVHVAKSLDADGFEHVFGNIGSFINGVLILWYFGYIINIYTLGVWVGISTFNTCLSHSNLKCNLDDGVHLLHHKYIKYNYGTGLYLCDRLMGTYKKV